MTGPEHYQKAEELAGFAENADADAPPESVALMLQFAQLHATLALTAATAAGAGLVNTGDLGVPSAWARALEGRRTS